jgi:hypothetical protein
MAGGDIVLIDMAFHRQRRHRPRYLFAATDQESPDHTTGRDESVSCPHFQERELNVEGKLTSRFRDVSDCLPTRGEVGVVGL